MVNPARHALDRGTLENLLKKIPGFHGYLEKEHRRESDFLARKHMADQLQQAKQGLDNYLRGLVDAAQLDALPPLERVRSRLDGLVSKIRSAERGYSGMFDFVKVNEGVLDQVYALDMTVLNDVTSLCELFNQLTTRADTPSAVANDLLKRVDAVEQAFAKRGELLKGLSA